MKIYQIYMKNIFLDRNICMTENMHVKNKLGEIYYTEPIHQN